LDLYSQPATGAVCKTKVNSGSAEHPQKGARPARVRRYR
jgi:hypothetical protein